MQNGNDCNGAIGEGEPPLIPNSLRVAEEELPGQSRREWVVNCLGPVVLGCLFSGCAATSQIPDSASVADRAIVFFATITGPFCAPFLLRTTDFSHSPIAIWQALGVVSFPLIAAYPLK